MTDLTEQWKKGELPEGWYYVKGSRVEGIYAYTAEYLNNMYRPQNSDRIIEQVPSYEEWEQLQNWADFTDDYHELREKLEIAEYENTELKELLKECQNMIAFKHEVYEEDALIKEIDEALR